MASGISMAEPAHLPANAVPSGAHIFPPFDAHSFPSQLFWLIVSFVVLYLIMSKWALPQVARVIDSRQKRIAGDVAEAGRLKEKSDDAVAAYEKALTDARSRAQAIANATREKQAASAEAARKQLEDELNAKLAESEKTIAATKQAAMSNVRGIAEGAAAAIVERLIGSAPGEQAVSEAVGRALK